LTVANNKTPDYFKSVVNAACAKQYPASHFPNSEKAHNFSKLRRHLSGILAPRAQVRYHQVDASISIDRFRAKGELLKQQS